MIIQKISNTVIRGKGAVSRPYQKRNNRIPMSKQKGG
jgi:hypothetical protein